METRPAASLPSRIGLCSISARIPCYFAELTLNSRDKTEVKSHREKQLAYIFSRNPVTFPARDAEFAESGQKLQKSQSENLNVAVKFAAPGNSLRKVPQETWFSLEGPTRQFCLQSSTAKELNALRS